jgi:NAD(P)-dependent dehydrogenase (short-subunit alcohol dehydrogenase family)
MLTVQYARTLDGILVNAADPGYTGTDFNGNRGTQTVTEGTDAIVRLATLPKTAQPAPSRTAMAPSHGEPKGAQPVAAR